jgi:hypothetical protein
MEKNECRVRKVDPVFVEVLAPVACIPFKAHACMLCKCIYDVKGLYLTPVAKGTVPDSGGVDRARDAVLVQAVFALVQQRLFRFAYGLSRGAVLPSLRLCVGAALPPVPWTAPAVPGHGYAMPDGVPARWC